MFPLYVGSEPELGDNFHLARAYKRTGNLFPRRPVPIFASGSAKRWMVQRVSRIGAEVQLETLRKRDVLMSETLPSTEPPNIICSLKARTGVALEPLAKEKNR